jgi:hypothetical protein
MKLKQIITLITITAFSTGCMGTLPRPVAQVQYGDDAKSCQMLQTEAADCEAQARKLEDKRKSKVGGNIFIGVLGAILFWPALFFLDTKSDENAEIDALMKRRQSLAAISRDKDCEWCIGKDFSYTKPEKKVIENEQEITR